MNPKCFNLLLTKAVTLVNCLPFADNKLLSPHLLMFGQINNLDIYNILDLKGDQDIFQSKEDYFFTLLSVKQVFNQIRLEMIEDRKYSENSKKTQSYYDRMKPGVIVSIRSNEHYRGAGDRKLRPRYKYRFCIVKRTKSTVFFDHVTRCL